jgi:RNase adaptor protein for sRNA GlmZ degradation
MALKKIVSFGFKHDDIPTTGCGLLVVDIRTVFRNPYHNKALRYKRGTDPEVQADVMKTPNFLAKYEYLKQAVTTPVSREVDWVPGASSVCVLVERLGLELVPVEPRHLEARRV